MARIFITGSTDGLGQLAAKALISLGHQVVLHARNAERGHEAIKKIPEAATVVTADITLKRIMLICRSDFWLCAGRSRVFHFRNKF